MTQPTTKRCRIRACIDEQGNWSTQGYGRDGKAVSDDDLTGMVNECDDWPSGDRNWFWIEVDLPLPRKEDRVIHAEAIRSKTP